MNIRIRNNSIAFGLETAVSPFSEPIRVILIIRDPYNKDMKFLNRKIT
jgi:hypothetical protein